MSKRLLTLTALAAFFLAACSNIPEGTVAAGTGVRFVPQVADFLDNTGLGNQVTVNKDGVPYISYLTFPGVLAPGAIPVPRPIGAPYITTDPATPPVKDGAAVGLASLSSDGIWTRGAAAQTRDSPSGIVVPFGPATVDSLVGATADNTNGTGVAVDANGGLHVVWTGPDGVYYATAAAAGGFTAEKVFDYGYALRLAGPIGRPSVAADDAGTPWVAYGVVGQGLDITVATKNANGKWDTTTVASLPLCNGCPQPLVAPIGVTPDGPVVAYVDPSSKSVMLARSKNGKWTSETVASDVAAQGLSMAITKDGAVDLSFYDTNTSVVDVATSTSGTWNVAKVADVGALPTDATGNYAATTGVAVDDSGKIYVTWYDQTTDSVALASGDGTSFTPIQTADTNGGSYPSVAASPDGSMVYVSWYGVKGQDLRLGVYGDTKDLAVAAPSPTSTATVAPPTTGPACGSDGKIALDQVAKSIAFQNSCLVAPAGQPFTIAFDNQDAGIPHNIQIFKDSAYTPPPLFSGDLVTGVAKADYKVGALDAGTYYFDCVVHPTMVGVLAVVSAKK